jgi:hypothetical protein
MRFSAAARTKADLELLDTAPHRLAVAVRSAASGEVQSRAAESG